MYDRMHSRQIADYGGVVQHHAEVRRAFVLLRHGQLRPAGHLRLRRRVHGHPRCVKFNFWIGFAAATTLILGAAYTLWMVKRVVFGAVGNPHVAELQDIDGREFLVLGLLALCVLADGPLSLPLHRGDARLGGQPAQACCAEQALKAREQRCFRIS
jgi:NADH-quinone oxidoreductase subunit M